MEKETEITSNHTGEDTDLSPPDWLTVMHAGYVKLNKAFENLDAETKAWLAERKEAGKYIDPETAEIDCWHTFLNDPYRVIADFPMEILDYGKACFARQPGGIWVEFGDLPDDIRDKIEEKLSKVKYSDKHWET